VAGALLAEGHPRIVGIGGFRVSVRSRGGLIVLRNRDVPGVIGRVGTVLGEAAVNIAEYHQARLKAGGEALAAVSVDGAIDDGVVARLAALPVIMVTVRLLDLTSAARRRAVGRPVFTALLRRCSVRGGASNSLTRSPAAMRWRGVVCIQPLRMSRGSSMVTNASGSQRSTS
jgi:hypothetical protein